MFNRYRDKFSLNVRLNNPYRYIYISNGPEHNWASGYGRSGMVEMSIWGRVKPYSYLIDVYMSTNMCMYASGPSETKQKTHKQNNTKTVHNKCAFYLNKQVNQIKVCVMLNPKQSASSDVCVRCWFSETTHA